MLRVPWVPDVLLSPDKREMERVKKLIRREPTVRERSRVRCVLVQIVYYTCDDPARVRKGRELSRLDFTFGVSTVVS